MSQSKISLSFSRKIEKKNLQSSALQDPTCKLINEPLKHSISSFDKNLITSRKPEDQLVIPLISSKRDDQFKDSNLPSSNAQINTNQTAKEADSTLMSLDAQAAAAVIEDSKMKMKAYYNQESDQSIISLNSSSTIDADSLNEVGSVSTQEDYEKIAVESYGAALLRGMGWSKSKGVGKINRRVVNIMEPTSKSLGVTIQKSKQEGKCAEEVEVEELKKGCFVLVHSGRNRGTYGAVQTVDEDYLLIKPARDEKIMREVELNVRVVTEKEFKEFSRVINKDTYDQYKAEELKKKEGKREKDKKKCLDEVYEKKYSDREKPVDRNRKDRLKSEERLKRKSSYDLDNHQDNEYIMKKEKKQGDKGHNNYKSKTEHTSRDAKALSYNEPERTPSANIDKNNLKYKYSDSLSEIKNSDTILEKKPNSHTMKGEVNSNMQPIPWARENLRVRIIDKKYKEGKYHTQKVIIHSVDTVDSGSCITDEGIMLWDVKLCNLETVIPKHSSSVVLILNGRHKGQKAKVLELHKEQEKATVQLLTDSSVILKLLYDDICEYVKR